MTRQFTIKIAGEDGAAALHRRVLASLPNHFRLGVSDVSDAILVTDSPPPSTHSARAIVLDGLSFASQLTSGQSPVLPALRFAPRIAADASLPVARATRFSMIDIVATIPAAGKEALQWSFVEQLALIRVLTSATPNMLSLRRFGAGFAAAGVINDRETVITINALVSPIGRAGLMLDAVSRETRLAVAMDADATARPADIRLFRGDGMFQAKPTHQNSHRLTWLKVHALLTGEGRISDGGSEDFKQDLETARGWLP